MFKKCYLLSVKAEKYLFKMWQIFKYIFKNSLKIWNSALVIIVKSIIITLKEANHCYYFKLYNWKVFISNTNTFESIFLKMTVLWSDYVYYDGKSDNNHNGENINNKIMVVKLLYRTLSI